MKKYILEDWCQENPFKQPTYKLMEAPVDQPIPTVNTEGMPKNQDVPLADNPDIEKMDLEKPEEEIPAQEPNQEPELPKDNTEEQMPQMGMGEEDEQPEIDFETEKIDYINTILSQKTDEATDKLLEMRNIENLSPGQYKFIEDNLQIMSLSRDKDFNALQKKVFKQIKEAYSSLAGEVEEEEEQPAGEESQELPDVPQGNLDLPPRDGFDASTNKDITLNPEAPMESYSFGKGLKSIVFTEADFPEAPENNSEISGTQLLQILSNELEAYPVITDAILKLPSFYSMKSDLFRKLVASMINGVQIGSGGTIEDLFIPIAENGVGIKVCTRIYTSFGNIQIGKWAIQYDDPENYLSDAELDKLNNSGSPEEKEVLRKRVVVESIAESYKDRVFIVMIIDPKTGERHELGFDFAQLLRSGWKDGYISIDFKANVGRGEAGVKVDGELIDLQTIQISYVKKDQTKVDEQGKPAETRIELMKVQNGFLFLTIMGEDFNDFSSNAKDGLFYSTKQFQENDPKELKKIQRCVPDIKEILLKTC